jgi:hypothetical protein
MRMPYPYNNQENKILTDRFFGKRAVIFVLYPERQLFSPGEVDQVQKVADTVTISYQTYVDQALDKIHENHYLEHLRLNPGENCSASIFKKGLNLQRVSVWSDGSWAMVFASDTGILANNTVCASFPVDRPAFTSVIGH